MKRSKTFLIGLLAVLVTASAYSQTETKQSPNKAKASQSPSALTFIGRGDGPVVIVERDGTMWEVKKRQLTFYNRATPRVVEASRERAERREANRERAAELAEERAEKQAKEKEAKAEARKKKAEEAEEAKTVAEKKEKRQEKIWNNYESFEYKYGPNSEPPIEKTTSEQ